MLEGLRASTIGWVRISSIACMVFELWIKGHEEALRVEVEGSIDAAAEVIGLQ